MSYCTFEDFQYLDLHYPDVNEFQNLLKYSLFNDISLVKFS